MTFPTIVFGTIEIRNPVLQYVRTSRGKHLFIVPTVDTGTNPTDIGLTYINQDGVQKTTTLLTHIVPNTSAGNLIPVNLEIGDTGIRDIISIDTFLGGNSGDSFSLQSDESPPTIFCSIVTIPTVTYTYYVTTIGKPLFIIPTVDTGSNPTEIGFTYINQSNVTKTTGTFTTHIGPNTLSGTLIQTTLAPGDTGIIDIISINKFMGGNSGDSFNFESGETIPITFGTLNVITSAIIYTPGDSIPTGGFMLYIVPTRNVGSAGIDMGFIYVNQFGITKTTTVSTAINATTTSGTHKEVVLEPGDTGIRNLIGINYFSGGSTGDKFNLESWNEGLGRVPLNITRSESYPQNIESEPTKNIVDFKRVFSLWADFNNTIQTNIVQSGYPDAQLSLPIEIIEPDYEFNVNDFGLMRPITLIVKDNNLKKLSIELIPNQNYQFIDSNEQSTRLKWKWDIGTSQYIDTGFYKLTFDYDVQFNSTYFIFELLNKDGIVKWSTSTGSAINNVVLFKSLSWEFRLRCKTNYTAPSNTTDHAIVTNIRIEKYVELGIAELNYSVDMSNIYKYESVDLVSTLPIGTNSLLQLIFSDDDTTWSDWIGPDGTALTYFEGFGQKVMTPLPLNMNGFYYKWILYLQSDGRDTPILQDLTIYMKIKLAKEILSLETRFPYPYFDANPMIPRPISFGRLCPRIIPGYPVPPPGCIGGDYLPEPLSGNEHIPKTYSYSRLCPRITPGYPAPPPGCIGGSFSGELLSGRQLTARRLAILKTWLESVVGQVVSGYVQNLSGNIIRNAFSMILMSTIPTEISPGGASIVSNVNPDTGLYQAFFKSIIYDKRYIIIKIGVKNVALEGEGVPPFIDGSQKLEIPYNLQFACPIIDCDFNITRKV